MENNNTAGVSQSMSQGPRNPNPYILPASIVIAALIIGGALVYLVQSGSSVGDGTPKKEVNPLTLEYKGGTTPFSECLDAGKYTATASADNTAGTAAGVNSTPTTFVNGKKVVDASGNSVGANGPLIFQAIDAAIQNKTVEPKTGPLALNARDVVLGDPNAPVVVIEYGDYQCPYCELFHKDVQSVIETNYVKTGKVRFVFRDFPFLGQESLDAGAAVECTKELGKFWEYHNALYEAKTEDAQKYGGGENDGFLNRNTFLNLAKQVGL